MLYRLADIGLLQIYRYCNIYVPEMSKAKKKQKQKNPQLDLKWCNHELCPAEGCLLFNNE